MHEGTGKGGASTSVHILSTGQSYTLLVQTTCLRSREAERERERRNRLYLVRTTRSIVHLRRGEGGEGGLRGKVQTL